MDNVVYYSPQLFVALVLLVSWAMCFYILRKLYKRSQSLRKRHYE